MEAQAVLFTLPFYALVIGVCIWLSRWHGRSCEEHERIIEMIGKVEDRIAEAEKTASKEHEAVLATARDLQATMVVDHKELIQLVSATKEPLIEALTVLKSHVADQRK